MPDFKFKESAAMTAFGDVSVKEPPQMDAAGPTDFLGVEQETSFSKSELDQVSFLFKEDDGLLFDDGSEEKVEGRVPAASYDFYEPQEVDEVFEEAGGAAETNVFGGASVSECPQKIIFRKPTAAQAISDVARYSFLVKKFEKGRLVMLVDTGSRKPKPLMYLLQVDKELMAFRLLSPDLDVVIPNEVCGYPIRYLHPEFLRGSLNPLTGLKYQSLIDNFAVDNLINLNKEKLKTSIKGAKSIALPNGLVMLPPNLFNYCLALRSVVIPASVTAVSVNAFSYSNVKDIWFNGKCPAGFLNNVHMPDCVRVHIKPEFLESFRKE